MCEGARDEMWGGKKEVHWKGKKARRKEGEERTMHTKYGTGDVALGLHRILKPCRLPREVHESVLQYLHGRVSQYHGVAETFACDTVFVKAVVRGHRKS